MPTMRLKKQDGTWDKVPVLGSYQAVLAANEAATNAQNAATSVKKYKALWFDSVAAMKAEPSLTAGAYVNTAGYYTPNDGGGASYLIRAKADADVDDGGSLHQLSNGLVAELIVENGWVNTIQLGLAKNDSNGTNLSKLGIAINKGFKILVTDMYYLNGGVMQECVSDIVVHGVNSNCGFIYTKTTPTYLFKFGSKVKIIDFYLLKLLNSEKTSYFTSLTYNHSNATDILDMEYYKCSKCEFIDGATLERQNYGGTGDDARIYNSAYDLPSIKQITISDNKIVNCGYTFSVFADTCFDNFEFRNNDIRNFKYVVIDPAIENLPINASDAWKDKQTRLGKGMKNLIVENNIVINDDDWILDELSGDYYCLVVAETQNVFYNNNRVEGLKASVKIAVYDAYLSCGNVIYTNNIWRNNICFAHEEADWNNKNNTLIKCKSSGTRVYSNNLFETTAEYISMLISDYGAVRENCWVNLVSITSIADITIENNVFNIEVFRGFTSNISARIFNVVNNMFNIDTYLNGNLVSVYSDIVELGEVNNITTRFIGNTYNIKIANKTIALMSGSVTTNALVEIQNNHINLEQGTLYYNPSVPNGFLLQQNNFFNGDILRILSTAYNEIEFRANEFKFLSDITSSRQHMKHRGFVKQTSEAYDFTIDNDADSFTNIKFSATTKTTTYNYDIALVVTTVDNAKHLKCSINGTTYYDNVLNPENVIWVSGLPGLCKLRLDPSETRFFIYIYEITDSFILDLELNKMS